MNIKGKHLKFYVDPLDFIESVGRPAKNQTEFNEFADLCRKLMDNQLDWQVIYQIAKKKLRGIKKWK